MALQYQLIGAMQWGRQLPPSFLACEAFLEHLVGPWLGLLDFCGVTQQGSLDGLCPRETCTLPQRERIVQVPLLSSGSQHGISGSAVGFRNPARLGFAYVFGKKANMIGNETPSHFFLLAFSLLGELGNTGQYLILVTEANRSLRDIRLIWLP